MFSGYIEEGTKKALQLYNPTGLPVSSEDYAIVIKRFGTTGSVIGRFFIKAETDSDKVTIQPGGTVVMGSPNSGAEILAYLPNNQFFQTTTTLNKMTGNDWILLVEYDKETDAYGRVLDVIGDSRTDGPWKRLDENGNLMFDTENVALSKDRSALVASHNNYSDAESVHYWWNATQWDESMTFDETSADLVGSYDWLSYHFSDLFTCTSHEECPSTGFCASSDSKCKLCADCVFDADGIVGTCPEKCPAICHGTIPTATCPFCGASGAGGLKMPPSATGAITISKNATNLTWCSPQDYQDPALSLTSEASVEVLITYFESPISEAEMYTKSSTYKINPLSSEITKGGASSDCDHPYSVQLPQIDAYTKIHAEIKLFDEVRLPPSNTTLGCTGTNPLTSTHSASSP